jgi:Skp family chaperone for outer membrane proteins
MPTSPADRRARWWAALALLVAMPAPAQVLMTVDSEHLANASAPMVAIERARDAALAAAGPGQRRAIELAADGERSAVLEAIAAATAEAAERAGADIVLDRKVAERIGAAAQGDLTEAIEQALQQRFPGGAE